MNMKTFHRFILPIGSSIGFAILVVSALSIMNVLRIFGTLNFWDFYRVSFQAHLYLLPYLIAGSYIFILLYYTRSSGRKAS